jgi:hypothetical protein
MLKSKSFCGFASACKTGVGNKPKNELAKTPRVDFEHYNP